MGLPSLLVLVLAGPPALDAAGKSFPAPAFPDNVDLRHSAGINGVVTAVDTGSITVRGCTANYPSGTVTFRYKFSKALAQGEVASGTPFGYGYVPADVKAGDMVILNGDRTKGAYTCTEICITRRPGGRVPVSPGEAGIGDGYGFRHSELMNAMQDLEEKGTPLPAKFTPPLPTDPIPPPPGLFN